MLRRTLPLLLALLALPGCLAFHRGPMPGEPKQATYTEIDGVRLRYLDTGPRPGARAVVLLHGFASALETWQGQMPLLARDHRVIALDLKGFGWTDRPEGDYSPPAQAKLVARLLDRLEVGPTAVVAHSWGSSVALALALAEPQRVTRLVLYDAWAFDAQLPAFFRWARYAGIGELLFAAFYDQGADERLARAFHDPATVSQRLADDVDVALQRPGTKAAALAAVRGQKFAALEPRYRQIAQPTLLLWGENDEVALPEYGEKLAKILPNAELVRFAQCGHFPMLEVAQPSNRALLAFLAQPGSRAQGAP